MQHYSVSKSRLPFQCRVNVIGYENLDIRMDFASVKFI
jgi:hypothetical protein